MTLAPYNEKKLADLVDMNSPSAVLDEVMFIMTLIQSNINPSHLTNAFSFMVTLYQGQWPQERACNTYFHDMRHITDTLLAMIRLIHGAISKGHNLNERHIFIGLVGALAHDAGYIQDKMDSCGTGAKYTTVHVERSMEFVERYGQRYGLTPQEIPACKLMIHCTDLNVDVSKIKFPSRAVEILSKILGCADLIAQLADRIYLEKLCFLYREFREGKIKVYNDEMDLLEKTLSFFPIIDKRLKDQLGGYDELAKIHFNKRWGIAENLYRITMDKQKEYLEHILSFSDRDTNRYLRRKCGLSKS